MQIRKIEAGSETQGSYVPVGHCLLGGLGLAMEFAAN